MTVQGEFSVDVTYQQECLQGMKLVNVKRTGPALLGRNWLHHINLDWASIHAVQSRQKSLTKLEKYRDVFVDGLGTIKSYKAKLSSSQISIFT